MLFPQDLKEECVKLRTRVFDLEQQNRILSLLFQQRVKVSSSPVSQVTAPSAGLLRTGMLGFCSMSAQRRSSVPSGAHAQQNVGSKCLRSREQKCS